MVKKCRICGYRFKDNDEVICPECFTSREDDMNCDSFGEDLHSHKNVYEQSISPFGKKDDNDIFDEYKERGSSFVDDQKKNEALNPIPSATYGPSGPGGARQQKLDALKNSAYNGTAPYNPVQGNPNQNIRFGGAYTPGQPAPLLGSFNQPAPKKSSNAGCIIAVVFIIIFVLPILTGIIGMISSVNSGTSQYGDDEDIAESSRFSIDVSMPDFSFPDVIDPNDLMNYEVIEKGNISDYTITANRFIKYDSFVGLDNAIDGLDNPYAPELWEDCVYLYDQSYADKEWRVIRMDITLENAPGEPDRSMELGGITVNAYDIQGNQLSSGVLIDHQASYNQYFNCYFLVPSDAFTIELVVPTSDYWNGDEALFLNIPSYDFSYTEGEKPFE